MRNLKTFESFGSKLYLCVETFNGEGYSEPNLKVCDFKDIKDISNKWMENYGDDYEKNVNSLNSEYILDITFNGEEDSGRLIFMKIEPNKYYLLKVMPDMNETEIVDSYTTLEEAKQTLLEIINDEDSGFEQDDVDDYDGELSFGSHTDDGYEYYEIIKS